MRIPRIYLKSFRDVRRLGSSAVLVVLVIAVSTAFTTGLLYTAEILDATTTDLYTEGNLPDYYIQGEFDRADLDRFSRIGVVSEFAARRGVKGVVETRDTLLPGLVYSLEDDPRVDKPIPVTGRLDVDRGEAVVGTMLSTYHGYEVGDQIVVQYEGQRREFRIVGTAISPSHLVVIPSDAFPVPMPARSSLVYLSPEDLPGPVNSVSVETRGAVDYEDRFEDAFPGKTVVPRARDETFDAVQNDLAFFTQMTLPFFIMLATVSLIITYTTTTKLVRAQTVETGVLAALGYTKREIFVSQALTVLTLSVSGAILGVLGALGFALLFAGVYSDVMSLPYVVLGDAVPYLLGGFLGGTLLPMLSSLPPIRSVLQLTPREAFSGGHRSRGTGVRLPGLGRLLRSLKVPPVSRYAIRNLSRRPLYTGLTIAGIALAAAIAGTWVFPMDSMGLIVSDQVDAQQWDIAAETVGPLPPEAEGWFENQSGITEAELYTLTGFELPDRRSKTGDTYGLTAIGRNSDMVRLPLVAGRMPTGPDEFAVSVNVAVLEDVALGDRIDVEALGGNRTVSVVGIYRGPSKDAYTVSNGGGNAVYLRSNDPGIRTEDVIELPYVASAVDFEAVTTGIEELIENSKVYLLVGAAVGVAIAVLFTFSNITLEILRRADEYNVMRALGYYRREILTGVVTEVLVQGVLAGVPGVALGVLGGSLLYSFALRLNDIYGYSMVLQADKFVLMFLVILVSMLLVVYPAYRALSGMEVSELNRKQSG